MSELPLLPVDWSWVPLGNLLLGIDAGKSFTCEERPPREGEYGIVKVSAVTWGHYDENESKTITDETRVDLRYLIERGDLLFSRANTIELVGATVRVYETGKRLLLSDKILRLRAPDDLKGWINRFLKSHHGRRQIEALSTGNQESMRNIGQERIRQIQVPIAPAIHLKRIESKIDELFSRIEEGERALERVQTLVERYRQSVLKAAVTGELTREWREQRQAQPESGKVHGASDLPEGWTSTALGTLCTKVTSGSRDWKTYYGRGDGVFIMAQNVRPGRLDLSEVQLVDPPLGSKDAERSQVEESDLLVTIVGANTGDVCRVDRPLPKHYVCQSVALMRLADARLSPYVALFLIAEEGGQAQFAETIYGAGRPHLSFDQLKVTRIPLPPLDEQRAICSRVQEALSKIDDVERTLLRAALQSAALRQGVLKAAFAGTLVGA